MWHDMGEAILSETGKTIVSDEDKTEKGFKFFLIATHFIWAYPKNGEMLASRFGIGLRQVQGKNLWRWVQMIASLKEKKFVWPEEIYNDPNGRIYMVSVDGVDFKVWEWNQFFRRHRSDDEGCHHFADTQGQQSSLSQD
jgi:hypothetical protein